MSCCRSCRFRNSLGPLPQLFHVTCTRATAKPQRSTGMTIRNKYTEHNTTQHNTTQSTQHTTRHRTATQQHNTNTKHTSLQNTETQNANVQSTRCEATTTEQSLQINSRTPAPNTLTPMSVFSSDRTDLDQPECSQILVPPVPKRTKTKNVELSLIGRAPNTLTLSLYGVNLSVFGSN